MSNFMTIKGINLLMHSFIIEEYPLLKDILIKASTLENLSSDNLKKAINELGDITYSNIFQQAINEWKVDENSFEYRVETTTECQVCGRKAIKNVYQIENIFTKKRLKVGKVCLNKFERYENSGQDRNCYNDFIIH